MTAPPALRRPLGWAIGGGVAWGLCHVAAPPPGLALVALAPLLLLCGARRAGWLGWLHGAVSWAVAMPWIGPTVSVFGQLPGWLGALAVVALALWLGIWDGLFTRLGAHLWRRGDALSLAALPALYVTLEFLRGKVATGFPWNLAAYAWIDLPGALPLAGWIGAFGVSALVVACSLGAARAVVRRRLSTWLYTLLLPFTLLAVAARLAAPAAGGGPVRSLAIVQPDAPSRPVFDPRASEEDYRRLLALTDEVCEPGRLVIWPESATWPRDWPGDARLAADIERRLARGCSLLLNTPTQVHERWRNSVMLLAPGQRPARADKFHLVPFGEYFPFRNLVPGAGTLARAVGDFEPADGFELIDWNGERLGPAVCYEIVFPGEVAARVRRGATLLVTVTNDSWYGDSAAPHQHLRAARFRAAENRRWLARAAITGISALVRPDGSLAGRLGVGEHGTIVSGVVGRSDLSPYSRAPWLVPSLAALLAAVAWTLSRR